jgi:hypothetical protein
LQTSGSAAAATTSLAYSRMGDRARFHASANGSFRQYSGDQQITSTYSAETGLSTNFGSRLSLTTSGQYSYSPFYQLTPYLNTPQANLGTTPPDFNAAAVAQATETTNGSFGLSTNLTRRSSVSAGVGLTDWRVPGNSASDVRTWNANASYSYRLSRALSFHLGYGRGEASYQDAGTPRTRLESFDGGLDYHDTLTFSRRTALSFGSSTSAIHFANQTHYRVNGAAQLSRGLSRSWSVGVGYTRTTEFMAGFRQPVLLDSANTSVSGQLIRRLRWSLGAGVSRGTVGFDDSSAFTSYGGSTRLEMAVSRRLGLFGSYGYYGYRVPANSNTLLTQFPKSARQSVSVGLSIWMPIINTARPRDSR